MPRVAIKLVNLAWLVLVFIGVPAITHASIGNWNITQASTARMLLFGGLALAAVANLLIGFAFKKTKDRILCWEWTVIFAGLLLVQYAYSRGYLNFDWLKKFLMSLRPNL